MCFTRLSRRELDLTRKRGLKLRARCAALHQVHAPLLWRAEVDLLLAHAAAAGPAARRLRDAARRPDAGARKVPRHVPAAAVSRLHDTLPASRLWTLLSNFTLLTLIALIVLLFYSRVISLLRQFFLNCIGFVSFISHYILHPENTVFVQSFEEVHF